MMNSIQEVLKKFTVLTLFIIAYTSAFSHSTRVSLDYTENSGQWNENVLFRSSLSAGGSVYLEKDGFTFSMLDPTEFHKLHDLQFASRSEQQAFSVPGHAWKLKFLDALPCNANPLKERPYYSNYFIGNDSEKWASHVHSFEMIEYQNIYENINLKVYSKSKNFKYDFIVNAHANPELIRFQYDGLEGTTIKDGNLVLQTSIGEFIENEPYAYQLIDGKIHKVECNYVLNNGYYSYEFPSGYNPDYKLVIDPELIASTLSGTTGFDDNYGHSAAYDLAGNIYTGCVASGSSYPVTTGAFDQTYGGGVWDIGISKLNPDGSNLLWATFLGGASSDYPHSLITNSDQEIYVYGTTDSADYPVSDSAVQPNSGGGTDIVITHLNADGSALIGSTYLGGSLGDGRNISSANYGDQYRGEILIDYDNNPIISSGSSSDDFPVNVNAFQTTLSGEQDAVIVKLTENLSTLLVSTFYGGPTNDMGYGIRTTIDGTIIIAGSAGDGLNITPGAFQEEHLGDTEVFFGSELDGFIAKFNSSGSNLIASTYYGTEQQDQAFFIDLDLDENIWIYGQCGTDIPVTEDIYSNPGSRQFVSKFNPDLTNLLIGTTIGSGSGSTDFVPDAFLVDNCANIYISAYNVFGEVENTDDALNTNGGFYVAVYEPDLEDIAFGTQYTGNHVDGGTSRFDKNGIVYQGVCSGGGFNTTANAWATDQDPGWDIGVFKIAFDASGVNAAVAGNDINGCAPFQTDFQNFSVGDQFFWDFGNGQTSTEYEPSITYNDPGSYLVSMIAMDSLSCNLADTIEFLINISTPQDFNPSFTYDINCIDQVITTNNLTDLDFLDYSWDMGDGTILETEEPVHQYSEPGTYTVSLLAIDNGCDDDEEISQEIVILPSVVAEISSNSLEACEELDAIFTNTSSNAVSYSWNFGDGNNSVEEEPEHTFFGPNTFEVVLTANNPNTCNESHTDTLEISVGAIQDIIAEFEINQTDCELFTVEGTNNSTGENVTYEWNMGDGTLLNEESIEYNYEQLGNYNVTLTVSDELCDITDQLTLPLEIVEEVIAVIEEPDQLGCAPFSTSFSNASVGASSFTWDFGDDSPTQDGENVEHDFSDPGIYTVTLAVEGDGGCTGTDEITLEVEIIAPPVLTPGFEMTQIGDCNALEVEFTNTSEGPVDNYQWDLGDGNQSIAENLSHNYFGNGTYEITLTVYHDLCEIEESTSQSIEINDYAEIELGENIPLCYYEAGTMISVPISGEDISYNWSTNENTQTIEVTEAGIYSVQVTIGLCTVEDALEVTVTDKLELDLSQTMCASPNNSIEIPYTGGSNYFWSTTETAGAYSHIPESGVYDFSFTDEFGCFQDGSFSVELLDNEPTVYIPNAFTPNGDGLNDVFKPVNTNLDKYQFTVFNRWGEVVFYTEDTNEYWQGQFQGGSGKDAYYVPNGVYSFSITYSSNCNATTEEYTGQITVVR